MDAKSYFEDCLRTEQSNEGLHIHYLMACAKVDSVDRLFDHYSKLYSDDLPVLNQAIKEDRNHIDEICKKYYVIPEYIEADVIREEYHFDRTYLSLSDCRREQLVQIEELIEKDRSLSWFHVHGSKDTKDRIDQLINKYENRLQEAIVQDEKSVEDVKRRYEDFLHEIDEEIRILFQGLLQRRDSHRKES